MQLCNKKKKNPSKRGNKNGSSVPTFVFTMQSYVAVKSRTIDRTETVNVGDPVFENVLKVGWGHGGRRLELCTTNNKA